MISPLEHLHLAVHGLEPSNALTVLCMHRMKIYNGTADAVAAVRSGKVLAYITDYATLKYFASVSAALEPLLTLLSSC